MLLKRMKYVGGILLILLSINATFAQNKSIADLDTKVEQLQDRLEELKSVNKDALTKEELKEWRREKREVRGQLNEIGEFQDYQRFRRNSFWDPYWGFYNPNFALAYGHPLFGYSNFRRFYYRPRRVIIVRPRT